MSAIVTADIHLNENQRDEYRWGLFEWLSSKEADELIICGDVTDAKDRHSAKLVNRFYDCITGLANRFRVILLKGNHDCFAPEHPFFQFLGKTSDNVFINNPQEIKLSIGKAFFVPALSQWNFKIPKVDWLFTHATFSGAKAEIGHTLTGVDPKVLDRFTGRVISGDVHVPQKLYGGKIEYVGAPYHCRFGDSFNPRILYIADDGTTKDLHFPAPRKHTFVITEPKHLLDEEASRGDHVKVRCLLRRAEYVQWRDYREEIRAIAAERGWLLFGIEPVLIGDELIGGGADDHQPVVTFDELLVSYTRRQKADKRFLEAGRNLLRAV